MSLTETPRTAAAAIADPTDRFLTASLLFAPLLSLASDATYAATGWQDATAGVLHVLGATAYAFVVWRLVTWTPAPSSDGRSRTSRTSRGSPSR